MIYAMVPFPVTLSDP